MLTLTLSPELDLDALVRIFSFLNEEFTVAINGVDHQLVRRPDRDGLHARRFDDSTGTTVGEVVRFKWTEIRTLHVY